MSNKRAPFVRFVHKPRNLDLAQVSELLASVGMRVRSPVAMRRAIRKSADVVVAFAGNQIVGFGRLISDEVYYGSLWDIAVSPRFQRQAIGSELVKRLLSTARKHELYMVGLFTALNNRKFYENLQFSLLQDIHPMTLRGSRTTQTRASARR